VDGSHGLTYYQGHNEQGMAHAAIAYAKQTRRRQIFAVTSSIGPGALNMVTAAGTATVNRIPVLFLPETCLPAGSPIRCSSRWSSALTERDGQRRVQGGQPDWIGLRARSSS